LFALRGLCAAAAIAWTLAVMVGAMEVRQYVQLLAGMLVIGGFMAAVGVLASVSSKTATGAMTVVIGAWLVAAAVTSVAALFVVAIGTAALMMLWLLGSWYLDYSTTGTGPSFWFSFETAYATVRYSLYLALAVIIASHCRHQFDRLAGRAFLTRLPLAPVWTVPRPALVMAEAVDERSLTPAADAAP
jgi:hypothetical protein